MREVGNGRYRLIRELGRGGMGAVWLGQDTVLGRDVAVKELAVPGGVPPEERDVYQERVIREARLAGRLADPAIVTVYDLIKQDDQTYIVMELIDAPTLTDLVARTGPLDGGKVAWIARQLLSALQTAHEAGIVHRDVKPGNVMVPAKGTAKLTDFGIAQSLDDPRLTATGALIGSPAYMSPERFSGHAASPAWDLWALGATLFYASEGYGPFERDTSSATMLAVMTERPQPTRATGQLFALIVALLEPDPDRRIGTEHARQLIADLPAATRPVDPGHRHGCTKVDNGPGATKVDEPKPTPHEYPAPPLPPPSSSKYPDPPVYDYVAAVRAARKRARGRMAFAFIPLAVILATLLWFTFATNHSYSDLLNTSLPSDTAPTLPSLSLPTETTTKDPESSTAMQPVLTIGPDGDIKTDGDLLQVQEKDCLKWTPAKGAHEFKPSHQTGCFVPHDVQFLATVYGSFDSMHDVPYPPVDELTRKGGTECTKKFLSDKVIGKDKEKTLRYWVIVPTLQAWKLHPIGSSTILTGAERRIFCFVGKADGSPLTEPIMSDGS
ncbi:serine/threonine-protein kinase [Actinocrispum sp. NPDC049592]|uniref:serine/threonine-protein kinase n=1 Tax=Actinocrispum sp. NPDC049592 TaxID=3154835 RepID=UPI003416AD5D